MVSGCPSRSRGPARADLALLAVRAELHKYTVCVRAMPRNELTALGHNPAAMRDMGTGWPAETGSSHIQKQRNMQNPVR